MNRKALTALVGALGFAMAATAAVPVSAAPLVVKPTMERATDVQDVQERRGFHRRGNRAFYNGHPGYRNYRPGYRRHNGFWFPAGAFIAGAIIGGALDNPRPRMNAHVRWCYDRYRSYRASDNTFQPNRGPRRQCYSPYR